MRLSYGKATVLMIVATAAFGIGVGLAGFTFGTGASVGAGEVVAACDPPCTIGEECLRGICVAPPAALPPMETLTGLDDLPPEEDRGVRAVEIGSIRHIRCEGPLTDDAKCFKSMQSLRRSFERYEPRLTDCFNKVAKTEPDLVGIVNLVYDINFTDETVSIEIDKAGNIEHPVIKECVLDAANESFTFDLKHFYERELLQIEVSFGFRPAGYDD